jgi:hypothetical protein
MKSMHHPEEAFPQPKPRERPFFRHPLRGYTHQEQILHLLDLENAEPVAQIYTIRSAINGEVILQSTPENEQQHVYNEVEGHEHQYSDFSPDIADDTLIQQRVEEKLHAIQMQVSLINKW